MAELVEDTRLAANPFPEWLAEVAADAVLVRLDDIGAEARGNQWTFALTPDQAAVVSATDVEKFAAGVAEGRRAWLVARGAGPMVLYWWHDARAGQLRFSLVSAVHGRLPFGCEVAPAVSLRAIAADWLGSPHLHGIPWTDLQPVAPDERIDEPHPLVLAVWPVRVPETPHRRCATVRRISHDPHYPTGMPDRFSQTRTPCAVGPNRRTMTSESPHPSRPLPTSPAELSCPS